MAIDTRAERLDRLTCELRDRARARFAPEALERFEVFLDIAGARAQAPPDPPGRALNRHLWFPGLSARPWWPEDQFELARVLRQRAWLLREEAASLLYGRSGLFSAHPGVINRGDGVTSPLHGVWLGYYLHENFRRVPHAAEGAPIALRVFDGAPLAREVILSFLGPGSAILSHSDRLNFAITVYLPLFVERGTWIELGGIAREWREDEVLVADTTYYHQSANNSSSWRGLLIADVWHPELTELERGLLSEAAPLIDDVLRTP